MDKNETFTPHLNEQKTVEIICNFIQSKIEESNSSGLVIGLSGGLDSSVVAYLSVKAVGNDKVLGLVLPSETTSYEDIKDAVTVSKELGIEYRVISIDELVKPFPQLCPECGKSDLAKGNLKARIRMMILYYHSNSMNRLVAGTSNRTELFVGYFTKYGDGGVDILPIGDLYKTGVRQIANYLDIPQNIIKKAPAAGLLTGQTDEKELGIKYELLDKILYLMIDERLDIEKISEMLKIPVDEVLRIKDKIKASKHKLSMPSIAEIR